MSNEQKLLHVALEAINALMAGAERDSDNEWGRICMPTNSAMSKGADAAMAIRQTLATTEQAAPAVPQGEPFGYFRAEPFGWTDCAETDEGAIALYEAPPDVETLRKELAGANDFIKSLADVCQKYEELLGYRKTNAPEGASELAEANGESSLNTELDLACDKSTCQHDFALDTKSSIRICLKCGTPERRAIKPTPAAPSQPAVPLTEEQIGKMYCALESSPAWGALEFYWQGIEDAEKHHGIRAKGQRA